MGEPPAGYHLGMGTAVKGQSSTHLSKPLIPRPRPTGACLALWGHPDIPSSPPILEQRQPATAAAILGPQTSQMDSR